MPVDPFSAPLRIEGMGFADHALDRADTLRGDAGAMAALRQRADARWLLFRNLEPVLAASDPALGDAWAGDASTPPMDLLWQDTAAADGATEWLFLGFDGDVPCFAADVETSPAGAVVDARKAGQAMRDARGGVIAQARALLGWHRRHRHCAVCGAPTQANRAGYVRLCTAPACKAEHFPRTDPVVIMLTLDGDHCLLGRQPGFPRGFYSALAGFVEPGETLERAVAREVGEEAGLKVGRVRYVASQPWPFPSSLMIGCFAEALTRDIVIDRTELEDARWFSRAACLEAMAGGGPFKPPPSVAIAHHLMKAWAELA